MARRKPSEDSTAVADAAKHEQGLQAVLFADSFTHSFRPLSLDRPKVLCPLNNVAMIDYSLDWLAGTGVEEVFVVCTNDQVQAYLHQQHVNNSVLSNMQVHVIKDTSITNTGDALREIDKRNVIQSDPFILMFGDTVTNVNLKHAIAQHKERHKKDSSAIMTLCMKSVGTSMDLSHYYCRLRSFHSDLVIGIDPTHDHRLLVYDNKPDRPTVNIPCSFFAAHPHVDLRYDLLDTGIDLCSPDVLARMADEFDYRDLRQEFVANSVAEEEEGLQNKLFVHLLAPTEYAARATDWHCYHAISQDLLKRWCYPVVPDNLPSGYEQQYRYQLQRHYMYHERKNGTSRIGRSTQLKGAGMLGSSCIVGENCVITKSVIGNLCHIAPNVTIKESHLLDAVQIEEGAKVENSILGDGCIIKAGAIVKKGCVIGAGCIVGQGIVLKEFTRITLKEEKQDDFGDDWSSDDDDDDDADDNESESEQDDVSTVEEKKFCEDIVSDKDLVGPDGKGRLWKAFAVGDEKEEESEDDNLSDYNGGTTTSRIEKLKSESIGYDPTQLFQERLAHQQEDDDDFSDDDSPLNGMDDNLADYYDNDGPVAFVDENLSNILHEPVIVGRQKGVDVVKELKMICLEYEATSPIENLAIELNSFKFSQNASYSDCTMAAMQAILEKLNITASMTDGKLVTEFKCYLDAWAPLLRKMSLGMDEEKAILLAVETTATQENEVGEYLRSGASFRFLLQTLHDEEIVSEEAILSWAQDRRETSDPLAIQLFQMKPVQDFLEWLEEESEEGSTSDGDEDSDDGFD